MKYRHCSGACAPKPRGAAQAAAVLAISLSTALMSGGAFAQAGAYPNKPVKIIVAQAPGGTTDATARALADGLSARWKQPVVVENKPGAGGNVGNELFSQAAPDGYTLTVGASSQHVINKHIYGNLRFDPETSFVPVAILSSSPMVLVVRNDFPANDFARFAEVVKASPGKFNYASAGNGTYNHLSGALLAANAKLKLQHIPYKGAAAAVADVMGGHADSAISTLPSVQPLVSSGKLRAIAVTTRARATALPNVSSLAEFGLDIDVAVRIALFVQAGTPSAIIQKIASDAEAVANGQQFADVLRKQGVNTDFHGPAEAASILAKEAALWSKVIKENGIKAD